MSESQIKNLVASEEFDEIPLGGKKPMGGPKVYGYDSATYYRGWPKWNVIGRWLRKRLGQPKSKVEGEFVKFWRDGKMDAHCGYGPIEYLNRCHIDREKGNERWRKGFYWDENDILCAYPFRKLWKNDWPDYNTIEKRKANKLVWDENWEKLSGEGPIGIGRYYVDADRGKETHPVVAIRTDLWNQGLPKDRQYEESNTWRYFPRASADFIHYLHENYKPVNILGVGVKTAVETDWSKTVNIGPGNNWRREYVRYMFAIAK